MHAKNNRTNSNFQIAYFLAGSCHTPDGAYALLCDLRESRSDAIKLHEAAALRERAKSIRAHRLQTSGDEAAQLDGQADMAEIAALSETTQKCFAAAIEEVTFIDKCIAVVQPLRKFKDMPDSLAHEACKQDEWKFELIHRAENFLLTTNTIPPDQYAHMRMHPEFKTAIAPRISQIAKQLESGNRGHEILLERSFDLPKLLLEKH